MFVAGCGSGSSVDGSRRSVIYSTKTEKWAPTLVTGVAAIGLPLAVVDGGIVAVRPITSIVMTLNQVQEDRV